MYTSFSLKPFILYIITKTVRFNYIHFSINLKIREKFPSLNCRHPPVEAKGCLKFRLKDFPRQIFTVFRYQWIKNPLIADDFYRFQFLSIGYSGMYLYPELQRAVDLNCEKLGANQPGQHQPSEQGFKPGFKD